MSGWLDFIEVEITCPFCNSKFETAIWEDGNPKREPIVITGLVDEQINCPVCDKLITYEKLK